jgi:N-acetylneuraminic acid mutarotase
MKTVFLFLLLPLQLIALDEWQQKATFGGVARHRASAFTIGDKGYVGMGHYNTGQHVIFKDLWEYDPATDSWTQKADFGGTLRYQCAAFAIDNYGYMGLGRNENDSYEKDFWKYDPSANMWYPIAEFPGVERRGATAFVIDNKAYVGLGQTNGGYASDFYQYNPNSDTWQPVADFIGAPRMNPVSFVYNGKAYVGTGHTWGAALKDFYEFNPTSNFWTRKADVGDSTRQDACGFCVMGEGYIGTGNNVEGTENYKDFWKYNFETDTWIRAADFGGVARRYMVSFVIKNTAYCWGGTNGTNLKDLWAFNPYLSVNETDLIQVNIYPNPATTEITFNFSTLNQIQLVIYNSMGQMVERYSNINNGILILNSRAYPKGVYFYQVEENGQTLKTGKFIFE